MTHVGLLGLRYRESRSSQLNEVASRCRGPGGTCLYRVMGRRLCAVLGGVVLVQQEPQATKPWSDLDSSGPSTYHMPSTLLEGGGHVDTAGTQGYKGQCVFVPTPGRGPCSIRAFASLVPSPPLTLTLVPLSSKGSMMTPSPSG